LYIFSRKNLDYLFRPGQTQAMRAVYCSLCKAKELPGAFAPLAAPLFPGRGLAPLLLILLLLLGEGCAKHSLSPPPSGSATGQEICATARTALGVRYKTGGSQPATGFDCSGLVHWIFAQHGIDLPRTAKEQTFAGIGVARKKLRPGDVVVFKISGRNNLHTGVYTGNGKFIHSPSSGKKVREDTLESKYWKPRFLAARRLPQIRER
jgi:hypothetical protein